MDNWMCKPSLQECHLLTGARWLFSRHISKLLLTVPIVCCASWWKWLRHNDIRDKQGWALNEREDRRARVRDRRGGHDHGDDQDDHSGDGGLVITVTVKIWEMVVGGETVATVDLEEATVSETIGKVEASTGHAVFPAA